MHAKQLQDGERPRGFVLVFERGDRDGAVVDFLRQHAICAARLTGIGAFSAVTLGYVDWERKGFQRHELDEQVELLSLTGHVALADGGPQVHAHVVVGRSDTTARGRYLLDAVVRPTLELIVENAPSTCAGATTPGLALIAPEL